MRELFYGLAVSILMSGTAATAQHAQAGGEAFCNKVDAELARLHEPAKRGEAEAQFELGKLFDKTRQECGRDVLSEVVKWHRKAAEQGHDLAQLRMGFIYFSGTGVPRDVGKAGRWWRKAAEQGNALAQVWIGGLLAAIEDYATAAKWYRKAAAQNLAQAQLQLGILYSAGLGVEKNYAEAVKWLRKAAQQGDAEAQSRLGYFYYLGKGIPQNYTESAKWFMKAAEQGDPDAMFGLGTQYYTGLGLKKDNIRAHMWLNLAVSRMPPGEAHDRAVENRELVAAEMTPAQLAQAQRLASEWRPLSTEVN